MSTFSGTLIAVEGIDGSGTSTLCRRLVAWLADTGVDVHLTCEPSTGPVGVLLRQMLKGEHAPHDALTLSLLFAADRADHHQREVLPALKRGAVVVSDRWYHSSLAYQSDHTSYIWVRGINGFARVPNLTVFVEVDPAVAASRRAGDNRDHELFDADDEQRRIATAYRRVMDNLDTTEPITIIDGSVDADGVFNSARDRISTLLERR